MAVINELIRHEADGTISFGNYLLKEKKKLEDFEIDGHIYKVKTYNEITKLEKNGKLLMETVPGAAIEHLYMDERTISFFAEAKEDVQITMELETETGYTLLVQGNTAGVLKSNLAGKVSFSLELQPGNPIAVQLRKDD